MPIQRSLSCSLRRSALRVLAGIGLAVGAVAPVHAQSGAALVPPADGVVESRTGKVTVDAAPIVRSTRLDRFRQLEEVLPTPNDQRTASGAPGHAYWQQRVDYDIRISLDEESRRLTGSETLTYTNHSPDRLEYLWVQIDPNLFASDSDGAMISEAPSFEDVSPRGLRSIVRRRQFEGGAEITRVALTGGADLPHVINDTMMRIDLLDPLDPGDVVQFDIDWNYVINLSSEVRGRAGAERLDDGTMLFEVAQWFPRMCQYTDARGWHNKQFLGRGEFSLEFGDYRVAIEVPNDHVVTATGELVNPEDVLNETHLERLNEARTSDRPVLIVTPDEADENRTTPADGRRTWIFEAEMVRDFAWASSRAFAWDAKLHDVATLDGGRRGVWCMSFFPSEGEPLWSRYSTHAIMHTLDVYSKYSFPYPYPVAISVNGPVGGMEYPMICFNGPRPEEDGTYTKRTKYGLIGVIIHEVGHFYFPMIVNSDERQWTWMDEGINTFLQFLTEQEWEEDYPSRRGDPANIVAYMRSTNQVPIMTNSESILQFGANAYAKPATALNILRETVMGRELFDHAFRTYARRWMFKNPQPADFFRTMEDASGVDLDWFWRGWFYSTEHVDLGIESVATWSTASMDLDDRSAADKADRDAIRDTITKERNVGIPRRTDRFPELLDFYNEYDELDVMPSDRRRMDRMMDRLEDDEADWLELEGVNFHVVTVRNVGGLPMPVILELTYTDGTVEERRIPAQIWQKSSETVRILVMNEREIESILLDPRQETADVELADNAWPPKPVASRFEVYKRSRDRNPMQQLRDAEDGVDQDDLDDEDDDR
ncbi:MAG: M1 family metallopeptidase [Phycisphaerales bacterium]